MHLASRHGSTLVHLRPRRLVAPLLPLLRGRRRRLGLAGSRRGHRSLPKRRGPLRRWPASRDRHRRARRASGGHSHGRPRHLCRDGRIFRADGLGTHGRRALRHLLSPPLLGLRPRGRRCQPRRAPGRRGHHRATVDSRAAPALRCARGRVTPRLPRPLELPGTDRRPRRRGAGGASRTGARSGQVATGLGAGPYRPPGRALLDASTPWRALTGEGARPRAGAGRAAGRYGRGPRAATGSARRLGGCRLTWAFSGPGSLGKPVARSPRSRRPPAGSCRGADAPGGHSSSRGHRSPRGRLRPRLRPCLARPGRGGPGARASRGHTGRGVPRPRCGAEKARPPARRSLSMRR